ncbi:MAG TPA: META domain-containing protein [Pyrinomonadaceae bacterium]|nr:META domain-containing protein [Pyrinomonadaceae bacterium]
MKTLGLIVLMATATVASFAQADRVGMRQWKLVEVAGMNVGPTSKAYIEIDQTRFTGHTGCNRMFGTADLQGRQLDFSNIGTTKMACIEPRAQRVETAFVKALENADRFRQRGNSLELYDRTRLVMKLTGVTRQETAIGLRDRKWVLDSIGGTSTGKLGKTAFIVFDEQKLSAGGNSSCNVFGGSYTSTGTALKFTDVMSTMRACIEDERMSIERQFLDGLQKTNRYEIAKEKLMLYRDKKLLLTFVGEKK